ncbi:hypothetical protein [Mastigocoleus sp. MO_188.B34]|uniref:CBU_0592 family membrane protein n=1 Tax=Mastigocoleus sp. MO_188.B34 TaxID=3036635 RepID=UPI002619FE81|nr:hypothetical protein [Mastigocoleus sp. MO_188.B34]MDJ0696453.1 hypothetical protein [Mastigocoleus sp. MO_188.B34]
MNLMIVEMLGWLGTATYISAYILLTTGFISTERIYLNLNVIAAALVMIVSVAKASWPSVFINLFWGLITISQIVNYPLILSQWVKPIFQRFMMLLLGCALSFIFAGNHYVGVHILAWCSTVGYSSSYLLFLNGRLGIIEFHQWNFLVAIILIPQLLWVRNWPVIAIQVFWLGIALLGILHQYQRRKHI